MNRLLAIFLVMSLLSLTGCCKLDEPLLQQCILKFDEVSRHPNSRTDTEHLKRLVDMKEDIKMEIAMQNSRFALFRTYEPAKKKMNEFLVACDNFIYINDLSNTPLMW